MEHFKSPDKFPDDAESGKLISVQITDVGKVPIEVHSASRFNVHGIVPKTNTTVDLWPNSDRERTTKVTICPGPNS